MTTRGLQDADAVLGEALRAPELLPFMKAGQKVLQMNAALQAQAAGALISCQIEGLFFFNRRFEAGLNLVETLIARDDLADAFDIVGNFVQNSTASYANEIGKIASIGARFAAQAAGQMRKEARNTVEDMAAATAAA